MIDKEYTEEGLNDMEKTAAALMDAVVFAVGLFTGKTKRKGILPAAPRDRLTLLQFQMR